MATAKDEISDVAIDKLFQLIPTEKQELHILTVGKAGTGKSTLVNTILGENAFDVNFGSEVGTTEYIQDQEVTLNGVVIHLCDTRGFFDGTIDQEPIIEAIEKKGCNFDIILVCMRFDGRFDASNKSMFHVLSRLTGVSDIWKKVGVALTHADIMALEWEDKEVDQKVEKFRKVWDSNIRSYLTKSIRINNASDVPIILTTHPKIKESKRKHLRGWLPNLLSTLAEHVCATPQAILALASVGARNATCIVKAVADKLGKPEPKTMDNVRSLFKAMYDLIDNAKETLDELKSHFITLTVYDDTATSNTDTSVADTSTTNTPTTTNTTTTSPTTPPATSPATSPATFPTTSPATPPATSPATPPAISPTYVGSGVAGLVVGGVIGGGSAAALGGTGTAIAVATGGVAVVGVACAVICLWLWKNWR